VVRDTNFLISILNTDIVVAHIDDGHVYCFPILSDRTVSLQGGGIKPNSDAKRTPRRQLFNAHHAATTAYNRVLAKFERGTYVKFTQAGRSCLCDSPANGRFRY
jgi:hypothetical protein